MEKLLFFQQHSLHKKGSHDVLTGFEQFVHIITPHQYF